MSETITAKVGSNRGRPRIWLDGKRLVAAHFTGGSIYTCFVKPGRIVCLVGDLLNYRKQQGETNRLRKVTGRPDGKPIIDLVGRDVEAAFGDAASVRVIFAKGRIEITKGD